MLKILGLIVSLLVCFGIGYGLWTMQDSEATKIPQAYKIMDDLEEKGIFGKSISFKNIKTDEVVNVDDFKDKVVIFSFWATWCAPCVDEFPSFIKLLDEYPDKIVLFAISHDENKKDVLDFINAFDGWRKNMHVVFDEGKKVSESMGVGLLPEGYVFNKEGKLIKKILGIQDWASPPALLYFKSL